MMSAGIILVAGLTKLAPIFAAWPPPFYSEVHNTDTQPYRKHTSQRNQADLSTSTPKGLLSTPPPHPSVHGAIVSHRPQEPARLGWRPSRHSKGRPHGKRLEGKYVQNDLARMSHQLGVGRGLITISRCSFRFWNCCALFTSCANLAPARYAGHQCR